MSGGKKWFQSLPLQGCLASKNEYVEKQYILILTKLKQIMQYANLSNYKHR